MLHCLFFTVTCCGHFLAIVIVYFIRVQTVNTNMLFKLKHAAVACSARFSAGDGNYSKTCVKRPLSKRPKIGFQYQLSLIEGQKYCRMFQGEHFETLLTFIKLPFIIKIYVLSIFEWPIYTGFTVTILVKRDKYVVKQRLVLTLFPTITTLVVYFLV